MQPTSASDRWGPRVRLTWALLAFAVAMAWSRPSRAAEGCRPAEWLQEARTGYAQKPGHCPEQDDALTAIANSARFVSTCGVQHSCGRAFILVRIGGKRFLMPSAQVRPLAFVYPALRTAAEDAPRPLCTLARTLDTAADFYPLDTLAGDDSPVHAVERLRPATPLLACRRAGDMVLAWLDGRPGLIGRTDVRLSERRVPQSLWLPAQPGQPQPPFCRRPLWRGTTVRPTSLYLPALAPGGTDESIALPASRILELLSIHRGEKDRLWYLVGHAAVRGWVRAEDVAHQPDLALADPVVPVSHCPPVAGLARATQHAKVQVLSWLEPGGSASRPQTVPLRRGTEVVILQQRRGVATITIDGVVARVTNPRLLAPPHRQVALAFHPADLLRDDAGGADQSLAFLDLAEGIPDARPATPTSAPAAPPGTGPRLTSAHTAGQLVTLHARGVATVPLQQAVAGPAPVRTPLDGQLAEAMAKTPSVKPLRRQRAESTVLRRVGNVAKTAGHLLIDGRPDVALLTLLANPDDGRDPGTTRFLMAQALLRLGYLAIGEELLLDVMEGQEGPLEQALTSYREAVRRFVPHPRAIRVLLPWCDGTLATDTDACFLGLQAAVDVEDAAAGLPFARRMHELPLDARQRALLALYDGMFPSNLASSGATADTSAAAFAQAVRQGCASCSPHSELVQALLLQAARAAWEAGDVEAAWRAVRGLVPEVQAAHGDLVASVVVAMRQDEPSPSYPGAPSARGLLQMLEAGAGGQRPELTLWQAQLQVGDCQFAKAQQTIAQLARRAAVLRRVTPVVTAALARAHGTLDALLRLDDGLRRVGVPSRLIPELDRALRPTGVCGQWRQVLRERDSLAAYLASQDIALPGPLRGALNARIAAAGEQCVVALSGGSVQLESRLRLLEVRKQELRIDLLEAQVSQIERAQRRVNWLQDRAANRFLKDWQAAVGETPSGLAWAPTVRSLQHPGFPIGEVIDVLQGMPETERERSAPPRISHLLASCGADAGQGADAKIAGQDAGGGALDAEVERSLRCLAKWTRGEPGNAMMPLLLRYLPALRMVRAGNLARVSRAAFHPELWRELQGRAQANPADASACLPEEAEDNGP